MERQIITSRQNPLVKLVCGLAQKKRRADEGLFRFDGIKLLGEALSSDISIKYVICRYPTDGRIDAMIEQGISNGRLDACSAVFVSDSVFEKISDELSPEGVITVARIPQREKDTPIGDGERILIAESLRDPGNLGTVMRSCYALGIDRLVLTDDCADTYSSKTLRAAMGAIFRLRTMTVKKDELSDFIKALRESGRRVYATALSPNSRSIEEISLVRGDCFVIGNEGHGLTDDTVTACTESVIIPMRKDAESLNAAAAASICIWETVKAR